MRKQKTRIELYDVVELFEEYKRHYPLDPEFGFEELTFEDENENDVHVAGGHEFMAYLIKHYPTYYFYGSVSTYMVNKDAYGPTTTLFNLVDMWSEFLSLHPEYVRLAQMLHRTDYDPLENYDRKEDGGWKDTTDDDATHKMKYAKNTTTTTNDPKIKTKTTGSVFGDNSTTAVPDTESVTEPVRASVDDVDTIKTENAEHTDEAYVEGDLTVTRLFQDYRVHGNIGVTTAAQMIEGEAKVRSKLVLEPMIYDAFVKEHFTLVGEVIL